MRLGILLAIATVLAAAPNAFAQPVTVGPYSFSTERLFAQTATFTPCTGFEPENFPRVSPLGEMDAERAVIGFTSTTSLLNVGNPCGPVPCGGACPPLGEIETVDLGFHSEFLPFEAAGPDLIIFDARFSTNDYAVAIRPVGGSFSRHYIYPAANQVPTNYPGPSLSSIWAVEVDFADFGLAPGDQVEAVRAIGDCEINPWVEFDIVAAAAVDRTCQIDQDCNDGDECTKDLCSGSTCSFSVLAAGTPCLIGVCDGAVRPHCVECFEDGHCQAPAPLCLQDENRCVECRADSDCTTSALCRVPICDDNVCDELVAPAGTPCAEGVCDGEEASRCVECVADENCAEPEPICDVLNLDCVGCLVDSDCRTDDPCVEAICSRALAVCETRPISGCHDAGMIADAPVDGGLTVVEETDGGEARDASGAEMIADQSCGCATSTTTRSTPAWAIFVACYFARSKKRNS